MGGSQEFGGICRWEENCEEGFHEKEPEAKKAGIPVDMDLPAAQQHGLPPPRGGGERIKTGKNESPQHTLADTVFCPKDGESGIRF